MTAPQCAGIIHTDFERGFIRAEVTSYDDYVEHGGEQGAKEAGKQRLEGKNILCKMAISFTLDLTFNNHIQLL